MNDSTPWLVRRLQETQKDKPSITAMEALTYEELRAMAVSPSERGAYSNSPLGEDIGLHVHGYEPDSVHVYVASTGKIAEVHPDYTSFLYRGDSLFGDAYTLWLRLPDPQGDRS
jgi:hypothetical protein